MAGRAQRYITAILLVGIACLFVGAVPIGDPVPLKEDLSLFPDRIGEWRGREVSVQAESLPAGTDSSLFRKYTDEQGRSIYIYVGYWGKFRFGAEVFSGNHLDPGYMWEPVEERERVVEIEGARFSLRETLFAKGDYKILLLYWYQTPRGVTTRRFRARLLYGLDAMLNRKTNVALVKVYTVPFKEPSLSETEMTTFATEVYLQLLSFLPHDRGALQ